MKYIFFVELELSIYPLLHEHLLSVLSVSSTESKDAIVAKVKDD